MRSQEEENEQMGMYDEDEHRLFKNTDSNGRFHSDWCSMMYSRLMLARNLLKDDGVIFISIDDSEVENLRKIADELFGEINFIADLIWQKSFHAQMMQHTFLQCTTIFYVIARQIFYLIIRGEKLVFCLVGMRSHRAMEIQTMTHEVPGLL